MWEISSQAIAEMDNYAISNLLSMNTGIYIDPSLPRTKFITELMRQVTATVG